MRVFIMAGGESSRMFPFSAIQEKSLLKIGGKPIIRILTDRLLKTGICKPEELTVCILGKHIDDFRWEFRDVPGIKFSPKIEATGTASHYYYAAELEQKVEADEPVMIHYADCLTEIDYEEFVDFFLDSMKDCCIAVTKNAKHEYSEVVSTPGGYVSEFHEKPELASPTWTGIAAFRHGVIKDIVGDPLFGRKIDFGHDIFPELVKKKQLAAYVYEGRWVDVGTSSGYMKEREAMAGGKSFV